MNDKGSLFHFDVDRKTIQRSAFHSLLIQFVFKAKGIITMPIMTWFMAPSEMGLFNIVNVTAAMLIPVFSLNLTDGPAIYLVREKSQEKLRELYATVFGGATISTIFLSVLVVSVAAVWWEQSLRIIILAVVLTISGVFFKLTSYVLAVFQKTKILLNNTVIRDTIAAIFGLVAVVAGWSYIGLVAAAVCGNIVAGYLLIKVTKNDLPIGLGVRLTSLRMLLGTAMPLLPVFFFSWIIQSSDSYFLAFYRGQEDVGKYAVIYGITSVILTLTFTLNYFWFPVSARLWAEDRERYRSVFSLAFLGFSFLLSMVVIIFELNSDAILRLFARRPEYHDAHVIMGLIAFAFAMQVLITLLTAPLYSNHNFKTILFVYIAGGTANLLLNLALIPKTGLRGAAVSTAVAYLIIAVTMAVFTYRQASFSFLDFRYPLLCIVFIASWTAAYWVKNLMDAPSLFMASLAFMAAGSVTFTRILRSEETILLFDLLRPRRETAR